MPSYSLNATLSAVPVNVSFGGGAATYAFTAASTGNGPGAAVATSGPARTSSFLGGPSDLASGADVDGGQLYSFSAFPAPASIPNSAADDFLGLSFTLADGTHYGYAEVAGPTLVSFGYNAAPDATIQAGAATGGTQPGLVQYVDTATGQAGLEQAQAYAGPVNYLQSQFLWSRPDGAAIASGTANVFLHGGPGDDALSAASGSNVLDGGTGSNFLTGATGTDGGTDTFFTDARGGAVVWSTVVNFHAGDAATLWGFDPGVSTWRWDGMAGAAGYTGATLRADVHGTGTTDASITFAGLTMAQAQGLQVSTGNVGGVPYLYLRNPGV